VRSISAGADDNDDDDDEKFMTLADLVGRWSHCKTKN
jgi:hypothetical protein